MEIRTERLHLREFARDDWRAVLDYQRDPLYLRYYPWTERTEEDARTFVNMFLGWQSEQPRRRFQLVIVRDSDDRLIGNCGIRRKRDNDWEADIGYELAPDCWGHGYATEAAAAIVDFGFGELGLKRISSWCIADNVASARVLERLGFQPEGCLRHNEYFKGHWWDTLLYGLLSDEWRPALENTQTEA
ncbi:MAG: GNAT family N-acetyltransferase [Dehalococcoidia bacterium]|nr:GNAT family N-acetyltransferase [Dehalococcoidia bacterium]